MRPNARLAASNHRTGWTLRREINSIETVKMIPTGPVMEIALDSALVFDPGPVVCECLSHISSNSLAFNVICDPILLTNPSGDKAVIG